MYKNFILIFIYIVFIILIFRVYYKKEDFSFYNNKENKNLWLFWEQGENNITDEYTKMCINGWRLLNPDWNIRLLNKELSLKYVPELEEFMWLSVQTRSDLLRTLLLIKYGGVWADASTLPLKPLTNNIENMDNGAGIFFYRYNPPSRGNHYISSWFIISMKKNNYLLKKLCKNFIKNLREKRELLTYYYNSNNNPLYFIYHDTLTELYNKNKKIRKTIDTLTITQDLPHLPQRNQQIPNLTIENIDNLPLMYKRSRVIPKDIYDNYLNSVIQYYNIKN